MGIETRWGIVCRTFDVERERSNQEKKETIKTELRMCRTHYYRAPQLPHNLPFLKEVNVSFRAYEVAPVVSYEK